MAFSRLFPFTWGVVVYRIASLNVVADWTYTETLDVVANGSVYMSRLQRSNINHIYDLGVESQ